MNTLLAFLLSSTLVGSIGICETPIMAQAIENTPNAIVQIDTRAETQKAEVEPRVEQTVWYERVYNGKVQKRLWSITNGCWLTDWIDV